MALILTVFAAEQIVLDLKVLLMALQLGNLVLRLALAGGHITLLGPLRVGLAKEPDDDA